MRFRSWSCFHFRARLRRISFPLAQRKDALSDTDFVAGFDKNPGHRARGRRRDRSDSFFIFQFEQRLVFCDSVTLLNKEVYYRARVRAFAEIF